jgi:hypothetical protein
MRRLTRPDLLVWLHGRTALSPLSHAMSVDNDLDVNWWKNILTKEWVGTWTVTNNKWQEVFRKFNV